ncbi:MAG: GAF domain-containing protein [Candidatus Rokubacteria bacterium]|nr:GAF domain-containing protein [Candidatus Rokubacteria bacterium]
MDRHSQGRRHPRAIVTINYRARLGVYVLAFALVVAAGSSEHRGVVFWVVLAAFAASWPHAAYLAARRSRDPRAAERRSVTLDAVAAGVISALLAFRLWPTVALLLPPLMSNMRAAGAPRAGVALLASTAAAVVTSSALGFNVHLGSNAVTTAVSILFLLAYMTYFALVTRSQGEALRRRGQALADALERQTATSEILRTLSGSQTNVERVFDVIIRISVQLCGASMGGAFRFDGEQLHLVAHHSHTPDALAAMRRAFPMRPTRDVLIARVVMDRDVVHAPDVDADPHDRLPSLARVVGIRSFLGVPMMRDEEPIGVIAVGRETPGPFTDAQIELLKTFADQAAIAVDNARLFEALQTRTDEAAAALEETRALSEVMQAIGASLDLRKVLDTVIRHAVQLSHSDAGAIFEYAPSTGSFVATASYNVSQAFLDRIAATPVDPTQGALAKSIQDIKPWQIADVEAARRYVFREVTLVEGYRSLMAVPIPSPDVTRGIVVFRAAAGRFDERVAELLLALATQSKIAVDNAALFQTARNQGAQLERLSENLQQLYRLSTAMQEPLTLREQLHRVLDAASRMGIIDRIYVWAVSNDGERFVNLAGAGFSDEEWRDFEGAAIPLSEAGAMAKAFREGTPLLFNRETPLPPELRLKPPYSNLRGVRTRELLLIPMVARGETVGVFTGDNKPSGRPISPATLDLLQTFASHAAVAVANARLFREIAEKSRQLEAASRHKSEFLANMSHELRTPLNAVIGFSDVLLEGMFGEMNEKQTEYLQDILSSGKHLLSLINDILDLSKIEAGRMELDLSEFDLRQAIDDALMLMRERANRRGITIERLVDERLGEIRADQRKVKQVLLNLLSNAVKFTPEGGRIECGARWAEATAEIWVTDTGIGIAPEDQEAVFEEFRQVGSADKKAEGTGLGLALCRKFVELHGGRIWVKSQVGAGATFTFTLPVQ